MRLRLFRPAEPPRALLEHTLSETARERDELAARLAKVEADLDERDTELADVLLEWVELEDKVKLLTDRDAARRIEVEQADAAILEAQNRADSLKRDLDQAVTKHKGEVAGLRCELERARELHHDSERRLEYQGKVTAEVAAQRDGLAAELAAVTRQRDSLHEFVNSLSVRVREQAELLARAANRGPRADRVAELEAALAPFVEILSTGWDTKELPDTAIYPVPMGDLRRANRVLAGLSRPLSEQVAEV
jgi:chromosome segregation ATPase